MRLCSNPHISVKVKRPREGVWQMRIGELSERTGTPPRLLRYYEEQGLLASERTANGYRAYDERSVDRVLQIRGLLDSGLSTRVIKQILPCLTDGSIHIDDPTEETLAAITAERDRMAARVTCLSRSLEAVSAYLDAVAAS